MTPTPMPTAPPSKRDQVLKEKYAESITGQSELMEKLGQQLISLELAIPGLYATVLKLISGDKATLPNGWALWLTFGLWFTALLLTWLSLIPRKWTVDPGIMKQDPQVKSRELGIEDFFFKTAQYKRRLLIPASLCLFGGIMSAIFIIF